MSETLINPDPTEIEFLEVEREYLSKRNAEVEEKVLELNRQMVELQMKGGVHNLLQAVKLRSQIKFILGDYEAYRSS